MDKRMRVGVRRSDAPVALGGDGRCDRKGLARRVLGDRVLEIFDKLEALGDAQATELVKVEGGAAHVNESGLAPANSRNQQGLAPRPTPGTRWPLAGRGGSAS